MYGELTNKFNTILESLPMNDSIFVSKIYDFSYEAHKGQKRKSGEDYFIHPLAVAISLWSQFHDISLLCSGLLHDTVEDNEDIHIEDIYNEFGDEIGFLVDSVTKNNSTYHNIDIVFEKKIDRFLYGGFKNIKCFLLKLADRSDNIKTLNNLKDNKQIRMVFETQAIFTPLSGMIRYNKIKSISEGMKYMKLTLIKKNISNYNELKNYLINSTFSDLSTECFDTIYQNTNNVTWKIKDRDMFEQLTQIPNIEEKIRIESIEHNDKGEFFAHFTFLKGQMFDSNLKLSIGDTYTFN